ncbi:MAG: VOC family protein [Nitrososphaerales archaeon]
MSSTDDSKKNGRMMFVNLAVKDLNNTKEFFGKLGFAFNPMFTDENAACMIVNDGCSYVMLLGEKFFKAFTPDREICDTKKNIECLVALSLDGRAQVDEMIEKAVAAGGSEYREKQDYGWMYSRAFRDVDGHIWELSYMDVNAIPEEMKKRG